MDALAFAGSISFVTMISSGSDSPLSSEALSVVPLVLSGKEP